MSENDERAELAQRIFNDCLRAAPDEYAKYGPLSIRYEPDHQASWACEHVSVYLCIGDHEHALVYRACYSYLPGSRAGNLQVFMFREGLWMSKLHEIADRLNAPIDDSEIWVNHAT